MAECTHNCETCGKNCADRKNPFDFSVPLDEKSSVKKVIGVVSGKGGVGKSMITGLLAATMARSGAKTAILDADITGPSIPKMFGLDDEVAYANSDGKMIPAKSEGGIDILSVNLIIEDPTAPVVWRGPVIAGVVKQFWQDAIWENEDYMFVDMPPGTGDVPLTVFQSLPIDGIVVVTTPQELVGMVVEKAIKMAGMMNVPVLGIVENMSYFKCPDCGGIHKIYGESHVDDTAARLGIKAVAKLPIKPEMSKAADHGAMDTMEVEEIAPIVEAIKAL